MKQHLNLILMMIVLCGGLAMAIIAAEPDWINYDERVVGENSPLGYTDVVNRPAKTIWTNFIVGHNTDGTHKPVGALTSPYTLDTLQFRNNSGVFEISDDSGSTWEAVGSGGGAAAADPIVNATGTLNIDSTHCGRTIIDSWGNVVLPSAATLPTSCRFEYACTVADCMLTPATGEYIRMDIATISGGWISNSAAYSSVTLIPFQQGDGSIWLVIQSTGTWYAEEATPG